MAARVIGEFKRRRNQTLCGFGCGFRFQGERMREREREGGALGEKETPHGVAFTRVSGIAGVPRHQGDNILG